MAFNAGLPSDGSTIAQSDDIMRENFSQIQNIMSAGSHTFPGTSATRGQHTPGQAPICRVDTEAVLTGLADVWGSISYPTDLGGFYTNNGGGWDARGPVPASAIMLFMQDAAPNGWTIVTGVDDGMVVISDGAGGAVSGGQEVVGGTWTLSGLEFDHLHEYSDIPAHVHTRSSWNPSSSIMTNRPVRGGNATPRDGQTTSSAGSTTPLSSSYQPVGTTTLTSDASWRPLRVAFILAQKD